MEATAGVTVIELTTAGVTVNVLELLLTPPLLAVMVVAPGMRPVARPVVVMPAIDGALNVHVKATLGIVLPPASLAVAVNC